MGLRPSHLVHFAHRPSDIGLLASMARSSRAIAFNLVSNDTNVLVQARAWRRVRVARRAPIADRPPAGRPPVRAGQASEVRMNALTRPLRMYKTFRSVVRFGAIE